MSELSAFRRKPPEPPPVTVSFEIGIRFLPALKSAIEEISEKVGHRLESPKKFSEEDALTYAALGLSVLRAAITKHVQHGSPNYIW